MLVLLASIVGCGSSDPDEATKTPAPSPTYRAHGIAARIPSGWDASGSHLSGLRDPRQLLTAGSFDLSPGGRPARGGSCFPQKALSLMPDDGALVAVTSYRRSSLSPRSLRRLPPRPSRLRLASAYRDYECGGQSYDLQFREGQRGYKIDVWFDPRRVEPRIRAGALRLINGLDLQPAPQQRSDSEIRGFQAALVSPTAIRVTYRLRRSARLGLIVQGIGEGGASAVIPFDAKGSYPDPTRSPSASPSGRDEVRIHFERGEFNFAGSPRLRFSLRASHDGHHDQSGPVTIDRDGLFGRARVQRAIRMMNK